MSHELSERRGTGSVLSRILPGAAAHRIHAALRTRSLPSSIAERTSTMPNTVRLHRVLRAPRERVYRAFLEPDALVKWLPPHGFTARVHHLDARVGGSYRMSFTNFSTGHSDSFGGEFLELLPGERIRHTDAFEDPNLPGTLIVTVALADTAIGTELTIVQEGIPEVIPLAACYLGWQESLTLLAQLVEPDIP
jgi:uncharacterized protein YndB with AHSA1/START domain